MSLTDDLANGETFIGWRFGQADGRKSGLRRGGFRGSAAFFALLLAAATSTHAEDTADAGSLAAGAHSPDGPNAILHSAATPAHPMTASSKFSRRRLPLSLPTLKGRSALG